MMVNLRLEDMEDMAQAAGYRFVWHWEDVRPVEPSKRSVRPMTKLNNDRLKPTPRVPKPEEHQHTRFGEQAGYRQGRSGFPLERRLVHDVRHGRDGPGSRIPFLVGLGRTSGRIVQLLPDFSLQ